MSTVEAAASLFGSDGDSGPDPFAVIGNEATDTTPPHDEHQTHTSSRTSQMGQEASSWFAEQMYPDAQQEQHDPWFIPTAQDAPPSQPHRQNGLPSSYDHPQRYHPGATAYQPPSSHASPPASTTYQSTPTSYEPYNPTPPAPYQPQSVIQYSAQQPYDPYKPTATISTSNSYTPHQTARRVSAVPAQPQATQYDNRSPAPRSVSSPYSASFTVPSQPPPNGVPPQAPKPPSVPSAAEFRPKVSNAYDPPLPPPKVHRTTSPSSLRFTSNSHVPVSHISQPPPINSYDHKPTPPGPPRTMSPSSIRSASPASGSFPPPKSVSAFTSSQLRGRSSSNGSTMSSHSVPDPLHLRKEYGLGFGSHIVPPSSHNVQSHHFTEQDVHALRSARPPYAPSPSLLGSNDPLGRTSSRAPVISFGFGGKVLTCFHSSVDLNTGFDVALSSRRTTNVTIRVVHQLLPDYVSETKPADYPGPLFSDPGSPVTSLVRTGTSQAKTKKARVIKYLEERAGEILHGTMYTSDNFERQRLEGKLVLVQLLKIMVENDGLLSGSPSIDNAVRAALLPRIAGSMSESGRDGPAALASHGLTSPTLNAYSSTSALLPAKESPISISTLLPSALDQIEEFLVRGERRQAYQYALDQRLWAHALVIASSVDKEAWQEAVNEFLKTELSIRETAQRGTPHAQSRGTSSQQTNGREWLRVAYSVFSGQGPSAVQELVPMNVLSRVGTGLQVPPAVLPHATPMSPNFPSIAPIQSIPVESLSKWPEIAASIVCSPLNPEYSATLSALGDHLIFHHLVEGAHVCYLLSPQTSVMGGLGSSGTRLVLLGGQSPPINPVFFRDPDPIIFTEIAEFAFSLKTAKGQDPFHGFPHLQAYKFIRAAYLADIGHIQSATRYCEAITVAMGRHSPYFTPTLVEGLKQLTDRLLGSPHIDKSTSWMGGKVNKPSLDSIGSWLEVRLTKFIAGEGNETSPSASEFSKAQFTGPFSSYSSITSATPSASSSPPPTIVNSYTVSATQPPRRSGSAMELPSTTMHIPVDRASSAMEYYRPPRHASPAPPNTAPIRSMGYPYSPYVTQASGPSMFNGYAAAYDREPSSRKTSLEITTEESSETQAPLSDEQGRREENEQQPKIVDSNQETQDSGDWWNSLSNTDTASTPTAATFHHVDDVREFGEGFISLMDDPALSMTPNMTASPHHIAEGMFDDEADNLGLGNSAHKRKQDEPVKMADKPPAASVQDTTKSDEKRDAQSAVAASTGSWLSRLWKRSDTPAPVRANLGEETTFYYDKEQKRWVNKKAGTEAAQPSAPPPPPSRAQTTSPNASNSRYNGTPNGTISHRPPPPRTASAIDLNASSTFKAPMHTRSNMAPSEAASMPNTPAPSSMLTAPPMGRSRSQAAKKNVRNRYVDVFQQEGSSGV